MIFRKIRDWVLPWNRIKIKTLPNSWVDRDEVLVHAMMQILVDYVEGEMLCRLTWEETCKWYDGAIAKSTEGWDKESTQEQYDNDKKIYEIYTWWQTRGKCYDPWDNYEKDENCECSVEKFKFICCDKCRQNARYRIELEDKFEQEKTDKCKELLNLRRSLWT